MADLKNFLHEDSDTTIDLDTGENFRWHGLDAPESKSPAGDAATRFVDQRYGPERGPLQVERRGQDVFGRTVGKLSANGEDPQRALVEAGHAFPRDWNFSGVPYLADAATRAQTLAESRANIFKKYGAKPVPLPPKAVEAIENPKPRERGFGVEFAEGLTRGGATLRSGLFGTMSLLGTALADRSKGDPRMTHPKYRAQKLSVRNQVAVALQNAGESGFMRNMQIAEANPGQDFKEAVQKAKKGELAPALRFALGALGEAIPSSLLVLGTGAAGGAAGGAVGLLAKTAIERQAAARLVGAARANLVRQGVGQRTANAGAKAFVEKLPQYLAARGSVAGVIAGSTALETGHIFEEIKQEHGVEAVGKALAAGTLAGTLDALSAIGFIRNIIEPLGGATTLQRVARAMGFGAVREGSTEAAQEIIAIVATASEDPAVTDADSLIAAVDNDENKYRVAEAMAAGAVFGSVFGGVSGATESAAVKLRGPQTQPPPPPGGPNANPSPAVNPVPPAGGPSPAGGPPASVAAPPNPGGSLGGPGAAAGPGPGAPNPAVVSPLLPSPASVPPASPSSQSRPPTPVSAAPPPPAPAAGAALPGGTAPTVPSTDPTNPVLPPSQSPVEAGEYDPNLLLLDNPNAQAQTQAPGPLATPGQAGQIPPAASPPTRPVTPGSGPGTASGALPPAPNGPPPLVSSVPPPAPRTTPPASPAGPSTQPQTDLSSQSSPVEAGEYDPNLLLLDNPNAQAQTQAPPPPVLGQPPAGTPDVARAAPETGPAEPAQTDLPPPVNPVPAVQVAPDGGRAADPGGAEPLSPGRLGAAGSVEQALAARGVDLPARFTEEGADKVVANAAKLVGEPLVKRAQPASDGGEGGFAAETPDGTILSGKDYANLKAVAARGDLQGRDFQADAAKLAARQRDKKSREFLYEDRRGAAIAGEERYGSGNYLVRKHGGDFVLLPLGAAKSKNERGTPVERARGYVPPEIIGAGYNRGALAAAQAYHDEQAAAGVKESERIRVRGIDPIDRRESLPENATAAERQLFEARHGVPPANASEAEKREFKRRRAEDERLKGAGPRRQIDTVPAAVKEADAIIAIVEDERTGSAALGTLRDLNKPIAGGGRVVESETQRNRRIAQSLRVPGEPKAPKRSIADSGSLNVHQEDIAEDRRLEIDLSRMSREDAIQAIQTFLDEKRPARPFITGASDDERFGAPGSSELVAGIMREVFARQKNAAPRDGVSPENAAYEDGAFDLQDTSIEDSLQDPRDADGGFFDPNLLNLDSPDGTPGPAGGVPDRDGPDALLGPVGDRSGAGSRSPEDTPPAGRERRGAESPDASTGSPAAAEDEFGGVQDPDLVNLDNPDGSDNSAADRGASTTELDRRLGQAPPRDIHTGIIQRQLAGSTQLIGAGAANHNVERLRRSAGDLANTGNYTKDDIVAVVADGGNVPRGVRPVDEQGRLTPAFKALDRAIEAGAAIKLQQKDMREHNFVGDRKLAEYLGKKGYEETSPGLFTPAGRGSPDRGPSTGRLVEFMGRMVPEEHTTVIGGKRYLLSDKLIENRDRSLGGRFETLPADSHLGMRYKGLGEEANQLIGDGAEGGLAAQYRDAAGDRANTGRYSKDDVVLVVADSADIIGAVNPIQRGELNGKFKALDKAIEAGATILNIDTLGDSKTKLTGHHNVRIYLKRKGYVEDRPGRWVPGQAGARRNKDGDGFDFDDTVDGEFKHAKFHDNPDKQFEVSTLAGKLGYQGDIKYSALNARLGDGRTIEDHYQQDVKGFPETFGPRGGKNKNTRRGQSREQLWNEYLGLWRQWAKENPDAIEELRSRAAGRVLTDGHATTEINQARALSTILNETAGRRQAPAGPADTRSLGERIATLDRADHRFFDKDLEKARQANKFIGRGTPGSSTDSYRTAAGDLANTGEYAATDTVFVSANGYRKGRVPVHTGQFRDPVIQGGPKVPVLTPAYADLEKAVQAGATIVTDRAGDGPGTRYSPFNEGEREVAQYLHGVGYEEAGDTGVWKPAPGRVRIEATTPPAGGGKKLAGSPAGTFLNKLKADFPAVRVEAKLFSEASASLRQAFAGRSGAYDKKTGTIYLNDDALGDPKQLPTVAHEFTHAVHRQHYDAQTPAVKDAVAGDYFKMLDTAADQLKADPPAVAALLDAAREAVAAAEDPHLTAAFEKRFGPAPARSAKTDARTRAAAAKAVMIQRKPMYSGEQFNEAYVARAGLPRIVSFAEFLADAGAQLLIDKNAKLDPKARPFYKTLIEQLKKIIDRIREYGREIGVDFSPGVAKFLREVRRLPGPEQARSRPQTAQQTLAKRAERLARGEGAAIRQPGKPEAEKAAERRTGEQQKGKEIGAPLDEAIRRFGETALNDPSAIALLNSFEGLVHPPLPKALREDTEALEIAKRLRRGDKLSDKELKDKAVQEALREVYWAVFRSDPLNIPTRPGDARSARSKFADRPRGPWYNVAQDRLALRLARPLSGVKQLEQNKGRISEIYQNVFGENPRFKHGKDFEAASVRELLELREQIAGDVAEHVQVIDPDTHEAIDARTAALRDKEQQEVLLADGTLVEVRTGMHANVPFKFVSKAEEQTNRGQETQEDAALAELIARVKEGARRSPKARHAALYDPRLPWGERVVKAVRAIIERRVADGVVPESAMLVEYDHKRGGWWILESLRNDAFESSFIRDGDRVVPVGDLIERKIKDAKDAKGKIPTEQHDVRTVEMVQWNPGATEAQGTVKLGTEEIRKLGAALAASAREGRQDLLAQFEYGMDALALFSRGPLTPVGTGLLDESIRKLSGAEQRRATTRKQAAQIVGYERLVIQSDAGRNPVTVGDLHRERARKLHRERLDERQAKDHGGLFDPWAEASEFLGESVVDNPTGAQVELARRAAEGEERLFAVASHFRQKSRPTPPRGTGRVTGEGRGRALLEDLVKTLGLDAADFTLLGNKHLEGMLTEAGLNSPEAYGHFLQEYYANGTGAAVVFTGPRITVFVDETRFADEQALAHAIGHEFGHVVQRLLVDGEQRKDSVIWRQLSVAYKQSKDNRGFGEWFADQVAEWAREKRAPGNALQSFFRRAVLQMEKILDWLRGRGVDIHVRAFLDALALRAAGADAADIARRIQGKNAAFYDTDTLLSTLSANPAQRLIPRGVEFLSPAAGYRATRRWLQTNWALGNKILDQGELAVGAFKLLYDRVIKTADSWLRTQKNPDGDRLRELAAFAEVTHRLEGAARPDRVTFDSVDDQGNRIERSFHVHDRSTFEAINQESARWLEGPEGLERILAQIPDALEDRVMEALQHRTAPTPEAAPHVRAVKAWIQRFYREYLKADDIYNHVDVHGNMTARSGQARIGNLGPDFFPVIYSPTEVAALRQVFIDWLVQHHNWDARTAALLADTIAGGPLGGMAAQDAMGLLPARFTSGRSRTIKDADPLIQAQFTVKDLKGTLYTYLTQAVKRHETDKRYGAFVERRSKSGVVKEVFKPVFLLDEIRTALEDHGATPAQVNEFRRIVEAYYGRLGARLNPEARSVMSFVNVYQNYRLMPMAVFSNLVDLSNPIIRSNGDVVGAWKGLSRAWKLLREKDPESLWGAARALGVTSDRIAAEIVRQRIDTPFQDHRAAVANEKFFRRIGLHWWTNASRLYAFATAEEFLVKHALRPGAHSARWLKELRVSEADINQWLADGKPLPHAAVIGTYDKDAAVRVQRAMAAFVEQSVFLPDATQRPSWGSDAHWMLVWYLKQFMFSFGKVMLGRAIREAKNRQGVGQKLMVALPFFAMFPVAMLGMGLRDAIKYWLRPYGDGKPATDDWTYTVDVVSRSGILGPAQLMLDAERVSNWGEIFAISLLGSTATQVSGIFREDGDSSVMKAIPGLALLPEERALLRGWMFGD